MSSTYGHHFDAIGRVPEVMRQIEMRVPEVFPGLDENFIPHLNSVIGQYAGKNGWDYVVVSLNKGLARQELDEFLERDIEHEGPIVIDPTASTIEHQVYPSRIRARIQKERLIQLNETTGDVMLILYGVDKIDNITKRELLMKRVRMIDASLDLIDRDIATADKARDSKVAYTQSQRIAQMKERLQRIGRYSDANLENNAMAETDMGISAELFVLLAQARMMMDSIDDQQMMNALATIESQVRSMPADFVGIGVSYEPYERAAMQLMQQERQDQAELKQAPPVVQPAATPPDVRDLDNNGEVDPGNKYGSQRFNPTHRPT